MKKIALALLLAIVANSSAACQSPVKEAEAAPLTTPYNPSNTQYFWLFGDLLGTNPPGYNLYYGCASAPTSEACGWTADVAEKLLQTIFGSANGTPPPLGAPAYCSTYSGNYCLDLDWNAAAADGAPTSACGWGYRATGSGPVQCWQRCGTITKTRIKTMLTDVVTVVVDPPTQITCPT